MGQTRRQIIDTMRELSIDIETYSARDIGKCGVYAYSADPAFTILLFAYSVDDGPVRCVDLARGGILPDEIRAALTDPAVIKRAFNAAFERVCLSRYLGVEGFLDPTQWQCTMVAAARAGLPLSLKECGKVLRLSEGKMDEGAALIRYFSRPARNGSRHMPDDAPDKWETFKAYNIRDVEVETNVWRAVRSHPVPEFDKMLYVVDQRINDRGVAVDLTLAKNAARMDEEYKSKTLLRMQQLTGLDNPGSVVQLKQWLKARGVDTASLDKKAVTEIIGTTASDEVREVLRLKAEYAKTSNKKYTSILEAVCSDSRVRGLTQFYGAPRTGRFSGRLVQLQNLPQNHMAGLGEARGCVKRGNLDELEMLYDTPTQVLSELIRTAFIAKEGHVLQVCDFSAIEARVIAWLAGEGWVLNVFRRGGDIYCATASQMFGMPVEKHGQNAELRARGKVAVLALGYGGGVAALEAMGGSRLGLSEDDERSIVNLWRKANPRIVRLWEAVENAAIDALDNPRNAYEPRTGLTFRCVDGALLVGLPSGRYLRYPEARTFEEQIGRRTKLTIEYKGANQTTHKWEAQRTYGGKLTENIVQAIARDILGGVLLKADRQGIPVVFHVHDEIVVEVPEGHPIESVTALFGTPPSWAPGLPLTGAAYETKYYFKD